MIVYSIQDLEKLSGVKAHTLRIWEKRYGIIQPKRTATNIRYYHEEDLRHVLNIALLNKNGLKISKIADLSSDEIIAKVAELSSVDASHEGNIDGMMLSMFDLHDENFNRILDKHIESKGMYATMEEVIYPFLDKLSNMWITGSVKSVHENFVISIIRRKLIVAIDKVENSNDRGKAILFLPENETQELSILYINYLLKSNGVQVINLGNNVPLIDVLEAHQIFKPHWIFTIFNDSFAQSPLQPYLIELSKYTGKTKIFITGYQTIIQNLEPLENIVVMDGVAEISSFISEEAPDHQLNRKTIG